MRFFVTQESTPLNYIVVPSQIHGPVNLFHACVQENLPEFCCSHANNGLFTYEMPNDHLWKKGEHSLHYVGLPYAKLLQYPCLSRAHVIRKCLGPKGLEVRVFFKEDDADEAHDLLNKIMNNLPLIEIGEPEKKEPARDKHIYEWYKQQAKGFEQLERSINEALKGITFPPQKKTGEL